MLVSQGWGHCCYKYASIHRMRVTNPVRVSGWIKPNLDVTREMWVSWKVCHWEFLFHLTVRNLMTNRVTVMTVSGFRCVSWWWWSSVSLCSRDCQGKQFLTGSKSWKLWQDILSEQLYKRMELLDLSSQEKQLLNVSYEAFTAVQVISRVELQNGWRGDMLTSSFLQLLVVTPWIQVQWIKRYYRTWSLELATDVYINYVNKRPCGDTVIHLFKGADSSNNQHIRDQLKIFQGQESSSNSKLYSLLNEVWSVQQHHMIAWSMFFLVCCFDHNCIHLRCKESGNMCQEMLTWFPGGPDHLWHTFPSLFQIEIGLGEAQCSGFCAGRFLAPEKLTSNSDLQPILPPSTQTFRKYSMQIQT